jgi:hypothetical protein
VCGVCVCVCVCVSFVVGRVGERMWWVCRVGGLLRLWTARVAPLPRVFAMSVRCEPWQLVVGRAHDVYDGGRVHERECWWKLE